MPKNCGRGLGPRSVLKDGGQCFRKYLHFSVKYQGYSKSALNFFRKIVNLRPKFITGQYLRSFLVDYLGHVGLTQEFRDKIEEVDSFYRSHLGIEAIVKETIDNKYYSLNDEELVIVLPGNKIFFTFNLFVWSQAKVQNPQLFFVFDPLRLLNKMLSLTGWRPGWAAEKSWFHIRGRPDNQRLLAWRVSPDHIRRRSTLPDSKTILVQRCYNVVIEFSVQQRVPESVVQLARYARVSLNLTIRIHLGLNCLYRIWLLKIDLNFSNVIKNWKRHELTVLIIKSLFSQVNYIFSWYIGAVQEIKTLFDILFQLIWTTFAGQKLLVARWW